MWAESTIELWFVGREHHRALVCGLIESPAQVCLPRRGQQYRRASAKADRTRTVSICLFNAPKPGSSLICWHCCVCTSTMMQCCVPSSVANAWTINNLYVCWGGDSYRVHWGQLCNLHVCWGGDSYRLHWGQLCNLYVCWGGDSYRLAKIHSHFDAVFGSDWTQVCVVGFEANPKHAARLTALARCYLSLGYKVQPQQQPLSHDGICPSTSHSHSHYHLCLLL